MKGKTTRFIVAAILLIVVDAAQAQSSLYDLTTNSARNPLGIDDVTPSLSWKINDSRRAITQRAYQIIVSSTLENLDHNNGDLWNSGKVSSDQSVHVRYKGKTLTSRMICYWKVKVWNNLGEVSAYSEAATWEMGLLWQADWHAQWITQSPSKTPEVVPSPLLRKDFVVPGKVKCARLYIAGLGYHEAFINNSKVGDHVLDPVVTHYDKSVSYVTHDATPMIASGKNVLGVMLGNGWYNYSTRSAWDFDKAPWRDNPVLKCQLEISLDDGSTIVVTSDSTWKVHDGPIRFNAILNGEIYDARAEQKNWTSLLASAQHWQYCTATKGPSGMLRAQSMPPIRVIETRKPARIKKLDDGKYLVDFGQNISGRIQMRMRGHSGDTITVQYGEKLNSDSTLDQRELARFVRTGHTQTDQYISDGIVKNYHPTFTYYGFQFVQVSGYYNYLTVDDIEAQVLHTDLNRNGIFSSSSQLYNKLYNATCWSFLTNYHSYPTDCPHREKIGWTGDAQLTAEIGLYNYDLKLSYEKWMNDFIDNQRSDGQISGIIPTSGWGFTYGRDPNTSSYERGYGPQWEAAFVTIPWQMFQFYGDTSVLADYYDGMRRYTSYLRKHAVHHLLDFGIDDHKPGKVVTDPHILASAFYFYVVTTMSQIASTIRKSADQKEFTMLGDSIRAAFNKKYFNPNILSYGNGGQTSQAMALYFNIADPTHRKAVLAQLIQSIEEEGFHYDAGVLGVKFITNVLMNEGRHDILHKILSSRTYPSFGYWIDQGATTLWQEWNGSRSLNHIMFGSFAEAFFKSLGGIRANNGHPGFKSFDLVPQFLTGIDLVTSHHESPYGTIRSSWSRSGNAVIYSFSIPANSSAHVTIDCKEFVLREQGKEKVINRHASKKRLKTINVGSGMYTMLIQL